MSSAVLRRSLSITELWLWFMALVQLELKQRYYNRFIFILTIVIRLSD